MSLISAAMVASLAVASVALLVPGSRSLRLLRAQDPQEAMPASTLTITRFRRTADRIKARSRHDRKRKAAAELIGAFAAELRAGQPIRSALARAVAASPVPIARRAAAVAELGGDVPAALESEAERDSLPALRSLAALWRVAEGSGAGLSRACDRLAIAQSDTERVRAELSSQLAGPRATARVLAGLPLFGILLGNGLGASPLSWLLGTPWGLVVLIIGMSLEAVGLIWIARLTRSVEDRA